MCGGKKGSSTPVSTQTAPTGTGYMTDASGVVRDRPASDATDQASFGSELAGGTK